MEPATAAGEEPWPPALKLAVAATTGAVFLAHLWIAMPVAHPSVVYDEAGYLGSARLLAGSGRWDMPVSPFYRSGYSVLITPIVLVFHDPQVQWRAIQVLNAALLASLLPLLVVLVRRTVRCSDGVAFAAATAGALAPNALATGISAIAENGVLPMVIGAVLAFDHMEKRAWRRDRVVGSVVPWAGLAVGLLYWLHPRFTLLAIATPLLLVWLVRHGHISRRIAVVNAAALAATLAVATVVDRYVRTARWTAVEDLQGGLGQWWTLMTSVRGIGQLGLTAIGQVWYLAVGSVGLWVVGAAVVAAALLKLDRQAPLRRSTASLAFLVVAISTVFVVSVGFFAQNQFRADHFVYGRHNDSFTPIVVAIGIAYLAAQRRGRSSTRTGGGSGVVRYLLATVVTVALTGAVLTAFRDPRSMRSLFSPFAVPSITLLIGSHGDEAFGRATVIGLAMVALLVGALLWVTRLHDRRRRAAGLCVIWVLTCGWFIAAGHDSAARTARYEQGLYARWRAPEALRALGVRDLWVDFAAIRSFGLLSYPWHLPDVDVHDYDSTRSAPKGAFVIAAPDDPTMASEGARIANLDQRSAYGSVGGGQGFALWVRPGPAQRRLAETGSLLPAHFPADLPVQARRNAITIGQSHRASVTVRSGHQVVVPVKVTHTGSGSPWPDIGSYDSDGRVRVGVRIASVDGTGVAGAHAGGELRRWTRPGEGEMVDVEIVALTELLDPLPPGRYRVQLGIEQVGRTWFELGGADATIVLTVI